MKKRLITTLIIASVVLYGLQIESQFAQASESNMSMVEIGNQDKLTSSLEEQNEDELPIDPELPPDPELPEEPETPELPEEPEVPEVPESPEIPETPEIPEVPETPEEPEKPEEPSKPEPPAQPEQPKTPQVPLGSEDEPASDIIYHPSVNEPLEAENGEQIVSVKDGIACKQTAAGLAPIVSEVTALPDGNISVKASDGSMKVLPNTGEVVVGSLSILGFGLFSLAGLVWKFRYFK